MSRIKQVFADLASQNHKALVSYITAGDPHPDKTVELMHSLVESGTDIIELGVPFSDPMADGPVIQAPTTGEERIKAITKLASGFLYYVSFKGITGANKIDADSVTNKVAEIRSHTDIPVAVGFGIKDAQTAALVSDCSDAIVVGSAIVNIIADNQNDISHAGTKIRALLGDIKGALGNN